MLARFRRGSTRYALVPGTLTDGDSFRHAADRADRSDVLLIRLPITPPSTGQQKRVLRNRVARMATTTRVRHPGAANFTRAFVEGSSLYVVSPAPPGVPLRRLLTDRQLDVPDAVQLGQDLLDVLDAAHARGKVHGWIDPDMVWVTPAGAAHVLGFGVRELAHGVRAGDPGGAGYRAPETLAGAEPDAAADLYGIGAVLHYAVTGRAPDGRPEPLPGAFGEAVRQMLARDPAHRPDPGWVRDTLAAHVEPLDAPWTAPPVPAATTFHPTVPGPPTPDAPAYGPPGYGPPGFGESGLGALGFRVPDTEIPDTGAPGFEAPGFEALPSGVPGPAATAGTRSPSARTGVPRSGSGAAPADPWAATAGSTGLDSPTGPLAPWRPAADEYHPPTVLPATVLPPPTLPPPTLPPATRLPRPVVLPPPARSVRRRVLFGGGLAVVAAAGAGIVWASTGGAKKPARPHADPHPSGTSDPVSSARPVPPGTPGTLLWSVAVAGTLARRPRVVDGVVVVEGTDTVALREVDGSTAWKLTGSTHHVTVADDRLYVQQGTDGQHTLVAKHASDGTNEWTANIADAILALTVSGDTGYFLGAAREDAAGPTMLRAIDARTGKPKWTFTQALALGNYPILDDDHVYVGGSGLIWAVDRATGEMRWQRALPPETRPSVRGLAGGLVIARGGNGTYALRPADGAIVWKLTAADVPYLGSQAGVAGDTLYTGSVTAPGYIRAVAVADGTVKWKVAASSPTSRAMASNGVVYVTGGDTLDALDPAAGRPKWRYPLKDTSSVEPVAGDGLVFAATDGGHLHAVHTG